MGLAFHKSLTDECTEMNTHSLYYSLAFVSAVDMRCLRAVLVFDDEVILAVVLDLWLGEG